MPHLPHLSHLSHLAPGTCPQGIVQQFGNLVTLAERVERDYFERLAGSDDSEPFERLP